MKDDQTLRKENPELYRVAREGGTEAPGTSDLLHADNEGVFHCAVCNAPLFRGDTKFDSGSGWPSFWKPISEDKIEYISDTEHGMIRTEVNCNKCGAHLGHVFDDGPKPTNSRYCINSISLQHEKDNDG